jgi:predicted TIM-barrel fold metal-dependent hydrolase
LPVVFAHSLFPRFDDAWRIVERHDNVWLEMTNVFSSFWDRRYVLKEYDTEKRLLLEGIAPHSERIMFGTDHPAGSGTLEEIYRTLDRAGLGESVRERLVGGTAERFVRGFWPDFDARDAKAAVTRRGRTRPTSSDPSR